MTDLERLDEAITQMEVRGATIASQAADIGIGTDLAHVLDAARAYRDLLANGERVVPDYEAALGELRRARPEWTPYVGDPFVIRNIVDAAIGDKLLVDPTTEEE